MRGGHGDAAKRQVADVASSRGVGNGVPDKFADYARFDDMFGASRIFTDGTARQRKKETEMYVKDVMERRVYGYTHDLRMHGEPLLRIPVGAPLDEQPSSRGKENPVAREDDRKRRDLEGPESKATGGRKKARMSPGAGAFAQGAGVKPSPRAGAGFGVGRGRHSDVNGITASLFEREDWETDPLWAAMEEAVANGGVGSLEELPLPGSALRATALAPHPNNFDGEFMQRSRFEEIEVRPANPAAPDDARSIARVLPPRGKPYPTCRGSLRLGLRPVFPARDETPPGAPLTFAAPPLAASGTHPQPGEQSGARSRGRGHGATRPGLASRQPDRGGRGGCGGWRASEGGVRLRSRQRREEPAVAEPAQLGADEPGAVLGSRLRRRDRSDRVGRWIGRRRETRGRGGRGWPPIQLVHVDPRAQAPRGIRDADRVPPDAHDRRRVHR